MFPPAAPAPLPISISLRLEVAEHLFAELEIAAALIGEVYRASRTVEEAHTQACLQIADVAGDQCARHAEVVAPPA